MIGSLAEYSPKTAKNQKKNGSRQRNVLLLVLLLMAVVGLGWLGFVTAGRLLFTRNDHFRLRRFELRTNGPGYWSGRGDQLAATLNLKVGTDNIFALNLGEIRERLLRIPAVESAEVSRILPDTIAVSIVERIPRASLNNPRSEWVVDSHGVVMSRFEAMEISVRLPVITGFSAGSTPTPGSVFEPALPALELLMNTIRSYPDIAVIYINVATPGKLEFSLRYRNQHLYRAIMPDRGRIGYLLGMLQSAIISAQRSGDTRNTFDLSFDGSVILR